MVADTGTVKVERQGQVAILRLSYPERRNALSLAMRAVLMRDLADLMADDGCRVLIVTGEGDHFCSGGDLSSFVDVDVTPIYGRTRMQRLHPAVRLLIQGEKPVIAAVEGHASGAGLCIAAACDIVVASREAKFSCPFNKVGLIPDFGGLWTLPLRMGLGRAKALVMSARVLDGEAAEKQGLVDFVTEPGAALDQALALAEDIATTAPLANALTKALFSRLPASLEEMLAAEADAQGVLHGTEDFEEGRTAFLEKRRPSFKGK